MSEFTEIDISPKRKQIMYKISEIAQKTGLSVATLRYYESIGLIEPSRLENNYREFSEQDLAWLDFIARAKKTGMSLEKILEFSKLRQAGDATIIPRISLLVEQEHVLMQQQAELEENLAFLRQKKQHYYDLLQKQS